MTREEFEPSPDRINKHPESQSSVEVEPTTAEQLKSILEDLKGDQVIDPDAGDIILGEPRLIELSDNSPILINKGETSVMTAVRLRAPWDKDDVIEIYEVRLASPRGGPIEHEWIIELDETDQVLVDRYMKQMAPPDTRPKGLEKDKIVADFLDALELGSPMSGRDHNEPGQKEVVALLELLQAYKG